jgi:hypothetical protein
LSLEGSEAEAQFAVLDLPGYVDWDIDGVVGWGAVKGNILQIDAAAHRVSCLSKLPRKARTWTRLNVVADSDILELQIPEDGATNAAVVLDTGSGAGVALAPQRWQRWSVAHPHQPMTVNSFFTLGDNIVVNEEAWAERISFGPLVLTDVPVMEAPPYWVASGGPRSEGSLGLAALKGLNLIVDGCHGVAYVQAKKTRPRPYQHNRLGAAFVPSDSGGNELFARVVEGSPAQEAGVRNGDVLLSIDELEVTKRHHDALKRFRNPPGTKLTLTLKRDGKVFKASATLRQFLGPGTAKSAPNEQK